LDANGFFMVTKDKVPIRIADNLNGDHEPFE
jgi:hypothetical protein